MPLSEGRVDTVQDLVILADEYTVADKEKRK